MMRSSSGVSARLRTAVSAIAVSAMLVGGVAIVESGVLVGTAWAQDSSGGPSNSKGNQGGQGQGSKGSQSGQGSQGGQGSGQGGPGADFDLKGPQAGGPSSSGSGGGKPAWAQEGIPEVELGRLSVARSPDQVLDRALAEAVATVTPDMLSFYNQMLPEIIADLSLNWDNISLDDSPLQNLALFQDLLEDRDSSVDGLNDSDTETDKLLAVFLGVASDKTVPISEDTVTAMLVILGSDDDLYQPDDATVSQLALDAEAVRIATLAGHDG